MGITYGTGEKIEGDNTDLTITSGAKINLTAVSDVQPMTLEWYLVMQVRRSRVMEQTY